MEPGPLERHVEATLRLKLLADPILLESIFSGGPHPSGLLREMSPADAQIVKLGVAVAETLTSLARELDKLHSS